MKLRELIETLTIIRDETVAPDEDPDVVIDEGTCDLELGSVSLSHCAAARSHKVEPDKTPLVIVLRQAIFKI